MKSIRNSQPSDRAIAIAQAARRRRKHLDPDAKYYEYELPPTSDQRRKRREAAARKKLAKKTNWRNRKNKKRSHLRDERRTSNGTIIMGTSKDQRDDIFRRDGRTCAYCGTTKAPFHIDHVYPLWHGGSSHPSNLVVACKPCNLAKGADLDIVWLNKIDEHGPEHARTIAARLREAGTVNTM